MVDEVESHGGCDADERVSVNYVFESGRNGPLYSEALNKGVKHVSGTVLMVAVMAVPCSSVISTGS